MIQTGTLGISQLLLFHRLFETGRLLPKETFPSGEISSLKERVFKDTFNTSQCFDHVGTIVVEVPQFTVVTLMSPPEGILLQDLVLFEFRAYTLSFVVSQSVSILLEKCVDTGNTTISTVF